MTKEELIRDEDYTEEEAEKMILQNKLDKANERVEELEDRIGRIREIVENSEWRLDDVHDLIDGYDEIAKIII